MDLSGWHLAWSDEFDGPAGAPPDPATWRPELGGGGWGNNELQNYTEVNAALDGSGHLAITVHRSTGPHPYTSARLISKDRMTFTYGLVRARIRLPRGVWPCFWMLGQNIDETGWPACGEIDVMENFGTDPHAVHGTIHGPGYAGEHGRTHAHRSGADLTEDFHVYAVLWEPGRITWYLDDAEYATVTPDDRPWPFDHDFYLLLNVAVGGSFSTTPDDTVPFPQTMLVDYIRIYRR
ncbi:glycoside hydrolase family 16 protein [Paractinoplanes rishiriensis]|uniref:Glycosyl hydrolase family 16 n=1 Tax=Paractinoplanes rishiriensis TaxID=1050105 RepID=A0A919K6M1_9ACTN|nr:glycoside hydrolase family 16 protein [Actinoplanes rishiriensis]GIF01912.1 glycosyl hydrolase family 16 [Actinoplanes rishiriensis]